MDLRKDVVVVGAGIVGCSVARELARYKIDVIVLEKESDVAEGASGANSGVIHSGFKEPKGSLKAKYCVEGNKRFRKIAEELDLSFDEVGTYTIGNTVKDLEKLKLLKKAGEASGIDGLEIIDEKELKKREPHVKGKYAMFAPEGGITDPHEYTIAVAENTASNGVEFCFINEVKDIKKTDNGYIVTTDFLEINARFVVNCAGVFADKIAKMVDYTKHKVNPCKGEYFVLDKKVGHKIKAMIYPIPPEKTGGVGVHLTPTSAGNIIIGPSAEYITCKDDVDSTKKKMEELFNGAVELVPGLKLTDVIHEYAGIRAKIIDPGSLNEGDFILEEEPAGFIQLLGIESPGLTAAPILAEEVAKLIRKHAILEENPEFNPIRKKRISFNELSLEDRKRLIKEESDYGIIVCRCEEVTKKEVLDALNNPLGVRTLKGLRIRSRASMGRCQGGFCLPKILKILKKEYGIGVDASLKGEESKVCVCCTR